mgnify:FL=1
MIEAQANDRLFARGDDIDISSQLHMEDGRRVRYIVAHIEGGAQSPVAVAALLREPDLRAMGMAVGDLFDAAVLDVALR